MGDPSTEDAYTELEAAQDALKDARVLLDGDGSDAGILNRLYYAVFHAAQAVLYVHGENPSSHGQVRRQFGQHVVLEGDASRDEGRLLGTLYDYRQEADYGMTPPDTDVNDLTSEVEAFVSSMRTCVQEHDSEPT